MVRGQTPKPLWLDRLLVDKRALVDWLLHLKLLKRPPGCATCIKEFSLIKRVTSFDGFVWYCSACKHQKCLRQGSIFKAVPRIPLSVFMKFMWQWSCDCGHYRGIGTISRTTLNRMKRLCENVVIRAMRRHPVAFTRGGTFAVDESLFVRRKYNRGRQVTQRWVFGAVNMAEPTKPMFAYVADRSAATLERLIQHWIPQGSTIVSDLWRGYNNLTLRGYLHLTVNHSQNFVDPRTGAHTNTIEGCWRYAKGFICPKKPRSPLHLQKLLIIYMWRKWHAEKWPGGEFARLLNDVSSMY